MKRDAYLLKQSEDGKRCICIDVLNESVIIDFLNEDETRLKRFNYSIGIILRGLRNKDIYSKEDINGKASNVTAIKMFKGGQNIRLYCKEQKINLGVLYIIIAELLPKKKDQKAVGKSKSLIEKVSTYEYTIIERK